MTNTSSTGTNNKFGRRLLEIVSMAAVYFLAGKLALLLAIPPGYATAVWPAAGLALAAMLTYGYRIWPGVLIGSFLVNFSTSLDTTSVVTIVQTLTITLTLSAGTTAQAIVGTFLIRRFIPNADYFSTQRNIIKFLLLAGPISSVTSATIGTTTLLGWHVITNQQYLHNWFTWWVGDSIGVLIFTPLALIWMYKPRAQWRRRRLSLTLPMLLTFGLVVVFFINRSRIDQERIESDFVRQTNNIALELDKNFDNHIEALHSVESFYKVSGVVTRSDFHLFTAHVLSRYHGIQGISWNPRVRLGERSLYEQSAKRDGFRNFTITELDPANHLVPASKRASYYPIFYIEPYLKNEQALGFDVASDSLRLYALQQAHYVHGPAATERITLVQDRNNESAFLVFLPIYGHHSSPSPAQPAGYIAGIFHTSNVIEEALGHWERNGIELQLYDSSAPQANRLLYTSDARRDVPERKTTVAAMTRKVSLTNAGRNWVIEFSLPEEFLLAHNSHEPEKILALGLFFIALLGAFLLIVTGRTTIIEEEVKRQTLKTLEREKQLLEAQRLAHIGSWEWNIAENKVTWSDELFRIFGLRKEEFKGDYEDYLAHVHPSDKERVHSIITTAYEQKQSFNFHHRIIRPDGTERFIHSRGNVHVDDSGTLVTMFGTAQDLTEEKNIKQKLEEKTEQLAEAQKIVELGNWLWDIPTGAVEWSEEMYRIYGYANYPFPVTFERAMERVHPDDAARITADIKHDTEEAEKQFREKNAREYYGAPAEYRIALPDGEHRVLVGHAKYFLSEQGTLVRMIGTVQNITERKNRELELHEAKKRDEELNRVLMAIGDGLIVTDEHGTIILVNQVFEEMLGWKSDEVIAKPTIALFKLIDDEEKIISLQDRPVPHVLATKEKVVDHRYSCVRKDGSTFPVSITASPIIVDAKIIGVVENFRDITKEKAIGQMKTDFLSVVAHQLKTPIGIIKGYTDNMLMGIGGELSTTQREYLEEIHGTSERAYELIHGLLNVSCIERGVVSVDIHQVDLWDIVNQAAKEYREAYEKKGLTLEVSGDEHSLLVLADSLKMSEAIKNTINNSLKFTDHGGVRITLGTKNGNATVSVADTGNGMDNELLSQVFSKQKIVSGSPAPGRGSGLGLYIAKEFMRLQQGDITVSSTPGKGSTFIFIIPLAPRD